MSINRPVTPTVNLYRIRNVANVFKNNDICNILNLKCFFSFFHYINPASVFFIAHTRKLQEYANISFSGPPTGTGDRTSGSCGKRRTLRIWSIGIGLVAFQNLCGAKVLAFHMELMIDQYKPMFGGSEIVKCVAIAVSALQVKLHRPCYIMQ